MLWVIFFLAFLLFVCGWILFVPLSVEIDTATGTYRLCQRGTVCFWLNSDGQPCLRVTGMNVSLRARPRKTPARKKPTAPRKKSRKRRFSLLSVRPLLRRIWSSFSVQQFLLDIDTDDVVLNAQLIPVFGLLSRGPVHLTINFQGHVYTRLYATIRLYKLSWAFLLFFFNQKSLWK